MNQIPGMPSQQQFPPMRDGDEKLFIQFYMGSIQDPEKTAEEGHPVFKAVPFIKIMTPGSKNTAINAPVDARYKLRFAKKWYDFEVNQTSVPEGMPLQDWPAITRAQADELTYFNIVTVEQLASVADIYGQKIMNFHELRRKAKAYLENAKDSALATKLSDENAALKVELEANKAELKRLSDAFDKFQSEKKGK